MSFSLVGGLHAFTVVARHASFSAAARTLGVSPSALSQSVRQLEERLGTVLFTRTTRSVALTQAGARLLERSGAPLEQAIEGLRTATDDAGELTGKVRLSVPETVTEYLLQPVIPGFLAAYPRVSLEIDIESRRVDIVREGFDAGVRMEGIPRDMTRLRLSGPFRLVVVGAPSYLARHGEPQRPEELPRHRCLGMHGANGRPHPWELERGKRLWRVPLEYVFVCKDRRVRMAMVEAGVGLAYVHEREAAEAVQRGTVKRVLEPYAAKLPGLFLYYPGRKQTTPAFRAFLDMLRWEIAPARGPQERLAVRTS